MKTQTPKITMTLSLTQAQWEAALEALAQFAENELCNDTYEDASLESKHLDAAEEVLAMLQAPLFALVG